MNKINYQKELDKVILQIQKDGITPTLLLHVCCAPCSSYCLEYLSEYFNIVVFYYNPNISHKEEYEFRLSEEKRLINEMNFKNPVQIIESRYDPNEFFDVAKGLEKEPEGGKRCLECFKLRLNESCKKAHEISADYITTTLTISPLKNAQALNEIGSEYAKKYGVSWLFSDFKKREGYKRSITLSKEYNLYRQNYCGCIFSKQQAQLSENEYNKDKKR
ncbi:MAG: epoxyqueuosine reductase QueH [Ruminococcus sp.]|nr:epoxyqueuosine reductase QueH [Ruminococcus sp.]